jgi:hypothetical protein
MLDGGGESLSPGRIRMAEGRPGLRGLGPGPERETQG